jgi:DNA-binding NtrC family response regulator
MRVSNVNLTLVENERRVIIAALVKHKGRRKEMAEDLGISERTLYRKLHQHELHEYYGKIDYAAVSG